MDTTNLVELKRNPNVADMRPGDTVRVSVRVVEGDRTRTQALQGVVQRMSGKGAAASFTVRNVFQGIGVERTFLFHSPRLEKVEVLRRGRVRRARLYYLRERRGKAARIREQTTPRPNKDDTPSEASGAQE